LAQPSIDYLISQEKRIGSGESLKNSIIFGLIFLLLALNCFAAPLQLSGDIGRSLLGTIANNTTNQTNYSNEAAGGLWSWGKAPVGHSINASGELVTNPTGDDGLVAVPL